LVYSAYRQRSNYLIRISWNKHWLL